MNLIALCMAVAVQQPAAPVDPIAKMIGKKAPAVTLKSSKGEDVDLAKKFGKQPVVLVFYRGVW